MKPPAIRLTSSLKPLDIGSVSLSTGLRLQSFTWAVRVFFTYLVAAIAVMAIVFMVRSAVEYRVTATAPTKRVVPPAGLTPPPNSSSPLVSQQLSNGTFEKRIALQSEQESLSFLRIEKTISESLERLPATAMERPINAEGQTKAIDDMLAVAISLTNALSGENEFGQTLAELRDSARAEAAKTAASLNPEVRKLTPQYLEQIDRLQAAINGTREIEGRIRSLANQLADRKEVLASLQRLGNLQASQDIVRRSLDDTSSTLREMMKSADSIRSSSSRGN